MAAKSQLVRELLSNASCTPETVEQVAAIVRDMERTQVVLYTCVCSMSRLLSGIRKGRDKLVQLLSEEVRQ